MESQYKILVVDDESDIIEFIDYNLKKEGYLVATAFNGANAIEIAKTFKPDLILLDVMMPVMDGIETCKQLKSDPLTGISQTPNLPLVPKLDMFKEQALYRIIIHIDGNVLAYRLLPSFLTGSLIFRVQSPYTHWLDSKFKAGKHYIAIKEDLSDL